MIFAVAGRRTDSAESDVARFPLAKIETVSRKIGIVFFERSLDHLHVCAAAGADLLSIAEAVQLRAKVTVYLPSSIEEFKQNSVIDRPGPWGELFEQFIERRISGITVLSEDCGVGPEAYLLLNDRLIDALKPGNSRAMIVWDGKRKAETDFTYEFKKSAESAGVEIDCISTL